MCGGCGMGRQGTHKMVAFFRGLFVLPAGVDGSGLVVLQWQKQGNC